MSGLAGWSTKIALQCIAMFCKQIISYLMNLMKTMGMTKIASPRFCKHSTIPCLCWIEATLLHDDADAWDDADDDDCDDEADEYYLDDYVDVLQVCHRQWNSWNTFVMEIMMMTMVMMIWGCWWGGGGGNKSQARRGFCSFSTNRFHTFRINVFFIPL